VIKGCIVCSIDQTLAAFSGVNFSSLTPGKWCSKKTGMGIKMIVFRQRLIFNEETLCELKILRVET